MLRCYTARGLQFAFTQKALLSCGQLQPIALTRFQSSQTMATTSLKFIDIGANLTDSMFDGVYRGKRAHDSDRQAMMTRCQEVGLEKIIITAGTAEETHAALELIKKQKNSAFDVGSVQLYTTIGVHPTRCDILENVEEGADKYLDDLISLAKTENGQSDSQEKSIVAVGEFGLDYDRLQFCSKEVQLKYFEKQFRLAEETSLPLFLHMRGEAAEDFIKIMAKNRSRFSNGVVHSFTGTAEEAQKILDLGLYIGINGCSLKTEQNLKVLDTIPLDKLMIETDAPYCDIRPTHASNRYVCTRWPSKKKEKQESTSLVKGRNEPCTIKQVLEVIASRRGVSESEASEAIYNNTASVFF